MKKTIAILIGVMMSITVFAESEKQLWNGAAKAYDEKDYESAVDQYQQLVQKGESADLYYNYANALFKAGYTGKAILYYERALRLDPSNDDIKYNLEFANLSKTDKVEKIEHFFIVEWYGNITNLMTSNKWTIISLVLLFLTMVMFLTYRFGSVLALRKTAFGLSIACFVLSILFAGHAFYSRNRVINTPEAILMVGSETARSTPDESGTEVFVIHEGTKVKIKSTLTEWSEVQLADGSVGWIRSNCVEVI